MFPSILNGKNNIACAAPPKALNRVPYILLKKSMYNSPHSVLFLKKSMTYASY